MKKLLVAMLALVLAFTTFGCAANYTEVPQENYAATMAEFMGAENEISVECGNSYRTFVKYGTSAEYVSYEVVYRKQDDKPLQSLNRLITKEKDKDKATYAIYVKDNVLYTHLSEQVGLISAGKKKRDFNQTTANAIISAVELMTTGINSMLEGLENINLADTSFIATFSKVEIAGNAGGNRKLRITYSYGENDTSVLTLSFDKNNVLTSVSGNSSQTVTDNGTTTTTTLEIVIEQYNKNISFPNLKDFA